MTGGCGGGLAAGDAGAGAVTVAGGGVTAREALWLASGARVAP